MNREPVEIQFRAAAIGRVPRVCFYASDAALVSVRSFAAEQGWRVGRWYTDDCLWSACVDRPGWRLVRQAIKSGCADGVVVPARSVVSLSRSEYAEQLAWFEARVAFIAVVGEGPR